MTANPNPAAKLDYVTNADGWTAGQWRAKGTPLKLTEAQAKYENVTPAAKASTAKK